MLLPTAALLCLWLSATAIETCKPCNQLIFKENKGQWHSNVRFKTEMHYANTYFEPARITYELFDTADLHRYRSHHPFQVEYKAELDPTIHGHAFRATFLNASKSASPEAEDRLDEYFNYYLGKDKTQWASQVSAYHRLLYKQLYEGIDLQVYSDGLHLKYDWVINAKSKNSASTIQVKYEGANSVSLTDNKLAIRTTVGTMVESEPYAYQTIGGERHAIPCRYTLHDEVVSFTLPSGYNPDYDLVIDPTLIFSTYSGSTADNFGYTATYDSRGNAYAAGSVFHQGQYPVTLGAFQTTWAGGFGYNQPNFYSGTGTDIGITKYKPDGSARIYSTYLGGNGDELPHSLIVNSADELFIFGTTSSNNFPVTAAAYDTSYNGGPDAGLFAGLAVHYNHGSDIFVTKFDTAGTSLLASTYIGGSDNDGLNYPNYLFLHYQYADEVRGVIDIDKNDNVYIASCTRSKDFPVTPGAYQDSLHGLMDGVLVKMDNNLSTILWASYLGGEGRDAIYSLALDANDNVFVCGGTESDSFPVTTGTLQTTNGGGRADGFITLFSKNGNSILRSMYYGTPSYDQLFFIQTDRKNNVYVLGQTLDTSNRFIFNAIYNRPKSGQYISKINYTLDTLIWSTRFGTGRGQPDLSPTAFLVDRCNSIYMAGWGSDFKRLFNEGVSLSTAGMYVTPDAYQHATDSNDFYVMVMKDDASAITYATYFGSPTSEDHVDGGTSRFDKKGVIYQSVCAGCGQNQNFPTYPTNVVSHTNNSPNCNNAIFKLDLDLPLIIADFQTPPSACDTFNYHFINKSKIIDTANTVVHWDFGDGGSSNLLNPAHAFTHAGTFTIKLTLTDVSSCNGADSITKQIIILQNDSTVTLKPDTLCLGNQVQIGVSNLHDSTLVYHWTPTTGLSDTTITNPVAKPSQTTTYILTATKGNCNAIYKQKISIERDSVQARGSDILCPNDTIQLHARDVNHLKLSYSWTPTTSILSGGNTDSPYVKPSHNTTFVVTATSAVGCVYRDSIQINVISSLQNVHATATPDTILYGDTSQLHVIYTEATTLFWDRDTTLSSTLIDSPKAFPLYTTTYWVTVSDHNACKVRDSVRVYLKRTTCESSHIFVPNAFSPNNDGKNDKLFVRGNFIREVYFTVYDRWGQQVFETRDIGTGWDGTFNGTKLDPAVFGWYVEGTCAAGEKFFKKGNVTILR